MPDQDEQIAEFLRLLDAFEAAVGAHATAYEGPEKRAANNVWHKARAEIVAWAEVALLPSKPVETSPLTQLRDQMAMAALQGIGTWMPTTDAYSPEADLKTNQALKARAEWAYRQADTMLEARKS